MTCMHGKEVNNIVEYNLLYDILNPPKQTKKLNSNHSPILHGCMNTRKGKSRFKKFRILLDSWCSFIILMVRIVENLFLKSILWCIGTRNMVILILILRLKWNLT